MNEQTKKKFEELLDKGQQDILRGVISEELADQAKETQALRDDLSERDPYQVFDVFQHQGWEDKSPEGRSYQDCIDATYRIRDFLRNNGRFVNHKGQVVQKSFKDAVHSNDMQFLFPKVVSNIVLEHMAPTSNILSLYDQIRFSSGTSIQFPVWSAGGMSVNLFLGEEAEPNELTGDMSSMVTASTGKVGIKASISEDTAKYSVIDLYALQLKWCGIALGMFKERMAVENLFDAATSDSQVLFNNSEASVTSKFGRTNGTSIGGTRNGTLSSYDLFEAYAHGLAQGSDLNTIIVHPLGWRALANNSILRNQAATNGGQVWSGPQGGSNGRHEVGSGLTKGLFSPNWGTQSVGSNARGGEIATNQTTFAGTIQILGQPFNVITSPFAPITKLSSGADVNGINVGGKYAVDILMVDPRDVGIHVVDETLYTREQTMNFDQIKETAFFERYGFASANKGIGLFSLKGVVATEGYDFLASPTTISIDNLSTVSAAVGPIVG